MSNIKKKLLEKLQSMKKAHTLSVGHLWRYKGKPEENKAFFEGAKQCLEYIEKFVNSLEEKNNGL